MITENAAFRGETIILYATGLGAVTNPPAAGQPASSSQLSPTTATPVVTIGGVAGQVAFSGLTPTYIGLYQLNVALPAAVPSGSQQVRIEMNGAVSNIVVLDVR